MTENTLHPVWRRSPPATYRPRLASDLQVDVVVVGGGVTGVTTALLLAEAGKSVCLLEARRFGAGVTGASTAHLTEAIDTRYHELQSRFGAEGARLVRASSRDAIEKIAQLAQGADCGFERVNGYLYTELQPQLSELDAELVAATHAGASVERCEVPLDVPAFGGICFANQAQVDPARYLEALASRLERTGAHIHEGVSMLDVETKAGVRVTTDAGPVVHAKSVVLATHAPFAKLTLQLNLTQYRSYALAGRSTRPPAGLFWDMADPYHYVRSAKLGLEHYCIVGGADHRTGELPEGGPAAPFQELEAYAVRFGFRPEARWSAQVVESADGLPFIGQPDADQPIYVATGFGGNGISFGTLSAMLISDAIQGRSNPYAELYRANRFKVAALGTVLSENLDTAVHALTDQVRSTSPLCVQAIEPGSGAVVKHGSERLAVYRDQDGEAHALSSVCTHLGCQVAFNPIERSWDCPCHGSRFDVDGSVLDGPATKPLEKRRL